MNLGSGLCLPAGIAAVLALGVSSQPLLDQPAHAQIQSSPQAKPTGSSLLRQPSSSAKTNSSSTPSSQSPSRTSPSTKPPSYKLAPALIPGIPGLTTTPRPFNPPTGSTTTPTPKTMSPTRTAPSMSLTPTVQEAPSKRKEKARKSPALLQPSLFCRTFLNASNQQKVGGFRVSLSGSDQPALVRQLSQQLRSYQQQGGSLSRCVYSGYLSPSLVSSRLNGQPPSALVRKADSYRIPVYSSYQQFLAANNQRASRFGVIVSQPSRRTRSGPQKIMRISVNNALVLFVDARNQQAFRLEPAGVSLRLMPLSKEVQQVLADAAKPSLQRLVDFKRLKKLAPRTSPSSPSPSSFPSSSSFYDPSFTKLSASLGGTAAQVAALPDSLTGVISPREVLFASGAKQDAVADEFVSSFAAALASSAEIAQVVPSAYCRVQSSFYPQAFCAQLETGAVQDLVQCESAFTGRDRELMLCRLLFDEVAKIQGGSGSRGETVAPSTDPDADAGVSDQNPDGAISDGGLEGPGDEIADSGDASLGGEGSLEGDFGDPGMAGDAGLGVEAGLDEYDDPDQMLPDGMSPPVAAGCNATNFGEQFLCLFLQALSGMMQEAFAK